jgi:uncharacterized membrane protein
MFWIDLLFVLVFALLLSGLLTWGFGWRHPARREAAGASALFLFLVLLFAMWAGAACFPSWGPVSLGAAWLGVLLVGMFVALMLLAVAAPTGTRRLSAAASAEAEVRRKAAAGAAFGVFFWILLFGLLIVVIVSYLR